LRLRYFIITAIVLLNVSLFSLYVQSYFSQKDYLESVDERLQQTMKVLKKFKWSDQHQIDAVKIEETIYDIIGSDDMDKFFIVRTATGKILFKSKFVDILKIDNIPTIPPWINMIVNNTHIRVHNLVLTENENKVVQIGVLLNSEHQNSSSQLTLGLLFLSISALGLLSSWLLSSVLFSPIRELGQFLSTAARTLDRRGSLPHVPEKFYKKLDKKDELRLLAHDLDTLLAKINNNNKMSRMWAAQMAHELKTPLSQLLLHIESQSEKDDPALQKSFQYIRVLKETINTFLDWAELENRTFTKDSQNPVSVRDTLLSTLSLLNEAERNRVHFTSDDDFTTPCDPNHLSQLIQNTLSNALKYSEGIIEIGIDKKIVQLSIKDKGAGLPARVTEKIGEPFNFGNSKMQEKGHGLGLAWIKTICDIYNWKFNIDSQPSGTTVSFYFAETALKQVPIFNRIIPWNLMSKSAPESK
jgi:signal transduction histidine kinase